jgi:hypothetical protein
MGTYTVELRDITDKPGQFGPQWQWKFEVTEDNLPEPVEGKEWKTFQWHYTTVKVNPNAVHKKMVRSPRYVAEALMGRALRPDEFLTDAEYEDLIGKRCKAKIIETDGDGRVFNDIVGFLPLRGQSLRAQIPLPTVQEPLFEGDDGSDIPFGDEEPAGAAAGKAGK